MLAVAQRQVPVVAAVICGRNFAQPKLANYASEEGSWTYSPRGTAHLRAELALEGNAQRSA